jgi:leucyl-tRNA synthetase
MDYNFKEIENKWQKYWADNQIYKTEIVEDKPKYYILDMFPYPSGAGLHVGHPLGYIATDIIARYKRAKGYNVLHPMGFDAFGLPAEQYAIQTGQHPAITTDQNIERYKKQLKSIGFSYDWDREIKTSDPRYYKWTQWIFLELFNSWYNLKKNKAEKIETLLSEFEKNGNLTVEASTDFDEKFTANEWMLFSDIQKNEILLQYRLAYLADVTVNWCPALGTVLANEEVKDGVSERGGYPVERKIMKQWCLRITAYAERLLDGLEYLDWPEPLKEMQRNWIGKSIGAEINFKVINQDLFIKVFTTRIDTLYGVTFLTLAPEHPLIERLTTEDRKEEVMNYIKHAKNRSERERLSDVKTVSGVFTGSYVENPFNHSKIPVWISDYVLYGYGTGAVMAVPSSDLRDYRFAKQFNLPIISVLEGEKTDITKEDFDPKSGKLINSDFLNGLSVDEAIVKAMDKAEELGCGKAKVNYKMRDAIFSRQRYWGEPIPIYYKDSIPYALRADELPLELPEIKEYKPTESGEPPLGRAQNWKYKNIYSYELSTMPGWAGSSWYYLRYMSPWEQNRFVDEKAEKYWGQVDFYLGGSEHATGHLLYARFWYKFLYDLGYVSHQEPFKKLVNQGMIQGRSTLIAKWKDANVVVCKNQLDSFCKENNLKKDKDFIWIYVDVNLVNAKDQIKVEDIKKCRIDLRDAQFEFSLDENGNQVLVCDTVIEKMSKSKFNVVNPDDIIEKYGADTFRLYEMFLGPIEQFKPWNTTSIEGVARFLKKLWRLFYDEKGNWLVVDEEPNLQELKILHKTIKKVEDDIERFSLNTNVSTFMIAVNELMALKCHKKSILEDLVVLIAPYAPHIAEELWHALGYTFSVTRAVFPSYNVEYLQEEEHEYPVSINGKTKCKISLPASLSNEEIEYRVLSNPSIQKYFGGKKPQKVIIVPKKIINIVF